MKSSCALLLVLVPFLGACTGPVIMGADAVAILATRPMSPPAADTQGQIAEHESWCYSSMGDVHCYPHAQDVSPGRLINVDPPSRYPLDTVAYRQAVNEKKAAVGAPTALVPVPDIEAEKKTLKEELGATGLKPIP